MTGNELAAELSKLLAIIKRNESLKTTVHVLEKLMSVISDFATAQNAFNDKMDNAIAGLTQDNKTLNDEIVALQKQLGDTITQADKDALAALLTRSQGISDKLEALDALTPPPPPAG